LGKSFVRSYVLQLGAAGVAASGQVHNLIHRPPLFAGGGAWESNLAGGGDQPPLIAGCGVFADGPEVLGDVGANVFKSADEVAAALDLADIDVEVGGIGLANDATT